jgi:hypothetical protein
MIQLWQIVKGSDNQIGIEDPKRVKYTFISFYNLDWMLVSINVTIYRTNTPIHNYHCSIIIMTAELRSSI